VGKAGLPDDQVSACVASLKTITGTATQEGPCFLTLVTFARIACFTYFLPFGFPRVLENRWKPRERHPDGFRISGNANTIVDDLLRETVKRIFFLSPAHSGGKRAAVLVSSRGTFELARQVQIGAASLGEVFAYCSGLYFRGKLAYARHFAEPPEGIPGVQIITPSRGVVAAETLIGASDLCEFADVPVDTEEPRFTGPLKDSVQSMTGIDSSEVILLGSVATGKYADTLLPILGERLLFPADFAGRGDMSRGALLLRCVATNKELPYMPLARARGIHSGSVGRRK